LSLQQRIRAARNGEAGFAIVIAVALIALVSIVAVSLPLLVQNEDSKSRRDQTQDAAFQAAEAGTNAVLSDLTQSTAFFKKFMAKGEATRTYNSTTYANDCVTGSTSTTQSTCIDKDVSATTWTSPWWTYPTSQTARANDTGWYSLGNGYQYLIELYPPQTTLTGLAATITRIDVTGRPFGSTNVSQWRTIETMIRPSSLTDFQAFVATSLAFAAGATTTGLVFVGEDNSGNKYSLQHLGTADSNLYAEGTVQVGASTLQNGAQKYDSTTNPTALCKLNNCAAVPFTNFSGTFSKVAGAATGSFNLGTTDSGGNTVDAWWLTFQSGGTVTIASCKAALDIHGAKLPIYDNKPTCGTPSAPLTLPTNGAIYSAADVIVSGVVKGQITVATAGNVYYGGNLTYNTPGVDVIGEEATGSIYVPEWAPDGSHNITIYSAQFSLNGAFESSPDWSGGASGTMNFYGSTAVYGVTPCSQTMGSDCTIIYFSGFFATRHYNYDNNLLFVQPPYWPSLGNAFTILVQRQL
jgi:Tfp pilus assembly protein PilX